MTVPSWLVPTLVGVGVLVAVTTAVLVAARVTGWWEPIVAVARALVQLAALSVILSGVVSNPVWVAAALLVMFGVASIVATRRGGWSLRSWALTAGAIGAGAAVAVAGVFATGALAPTARYALAVPKMTAAKLAQARAMRADHKSLDQIAHVLSVSKSTVARALSRDAAASVARTE